MATSKDAAKLVIKHFPNFKENSFILEKIDQGFTNSTFCTKINGQKYQIRITENNDIVNRQNEHNALLNINNDLYVYYDEKTGNSIKKWIKGKTLAHRIITKKIINLLNDEINKLHSIEIKHEILQFDPLIFFEKTKDNIEKKYQDLYLNLVEQNKNKRLVFSHNDISLINVIYDKKRINLIDFEWTKINHEVWDYANFIREANLSIKKIKYWTEINDKLEFNELLNFLFLTTCYALQWTYVTKQQKSVIQYRKKTLKKLKKYYKYLINNYEK